MNRACPRRIRRLPCAALILSAGLPLRAAQNAAFSRLEPLPAPRIAAGRELGRQAVTHANQRAGATFTALVPAVEAARVHWQVTQLRPQNYGTAGGAEITFFKAGEAETTPSALAVEARPPAIAERTLEEIEGG